MFSFQDLLRSASLPPTRFDNTYTCFSMAVSGKGHLEDGDKILLPNSALNQLAQMQVEYPMLFELSNPRMGKRTHCGVLEFSAEEGTCYIPFWMMQNLMLQEGDILHVVNVSLNKAKFVKFRPQSVDFLDITNPRAVLEKTLRKFTCVTVGDQLCIQHIGKNYYLEIREVIPDGAASIIETDCNVDFDAPVGYKETTYAKAETASKSEESSNERVSRPVQKAKLEDSSDDTSAGSKGFTPFAGTACRIDGKSVTPSIESAPFRDSPTTTAAAPPSATEASLDPTAQPRVSMIGNKYSKKKSAVSAFSGQAHTLKK